MLILHTPLLKLLLRLSFSIRQALENAQPRDGSGLAPSAPFLAMFDPERLGESSSNPREAHKPCSSTRAPVVSWPWLEMPSSVLGGAMGLDPALRARRTV